MNGISFNNHMKNLLIVLLTLSTSSLFAQQDIIDFNATNNGQTILTCDGFIIDSGGQGGPGYSNNENYTVTICPDTISTGDNTLFITVVFNVFDLDGTNTGTQQNPNLDQMAVFDGPNTGSPTLGFYNTDELANFSIGATDANESGCLTFSFYSNSTGTGNFAGIASCVQPCEPPFADAFIVDGDTPDSIRVCVGEPITFDATASTAADGFNIQEYTWNFIDGTVDNTSGSIITHAYENPGYYAVQLTLTDDNPGVNCQNLNVAPLKVYVSEYPTFYDFPGDTIICVNENIELTGIEDFGQYDTVWTGFPGTNIIDDGCLEDELGIAQSIPVTYTEFDPSATITSVDDILDICISMEHSFMGDLVVQLSCPDGTTINLQEQGGGGTQIGVPDQADNVNCDDGTGIGEGWEYCWNADATQTWTEWVDAQGGFGLTLPEGDYASVDPLEDLIGCPLQGTWQITVFDNWAADDGTIFEFGVTFDPSFYPDIVEFPNTVGESADSSFWVLNDAEFVTSSSSDLNTINIQPTTPGTYQYTYSVVNNFGCGFDSTVTINVVEPPEITAGPDLSVCDEPVTLQASVDGVDGECQQDAGNYTYCYENDQDLVVTYCPDNPGDGVTFMQFTINSGSVEGFFDDIFVYDGDNTFAPLLAGPIGGDLSGLSFAATNPSGCITFSISPDGVFDCQGGDEEPLNISVNCDGGADLVWLWSPTTGLSNPNIQNPTVFVEQATTYTVSAYAPGQEGCFGTDQVLVAPDAAVDPGLDTDTTLCYNLPTNLLTAFLGGNPASGGTWIDNNTGQEFPSSEFSPTDYPDGANFDLTYTVSNGLCENSSNLTIEVLPVTNNSCCQTNANAGPDAVACALTYQLQGDIPVGIGTWTGPDEVTFSDVNDPEATISTPSPGGTYTLTWTDNNGELCSDTDIIEIVLADSLDITVIPEDAICFNECSGTAIAIPSGGTSSNGTYSIEWSSGVNGGVNVLRDSLCTGFFTAKVTDAVGCVDSTTFEIGQPEPLDMSVLGRGALCKDSCNARVIITSPDAVEYTYNGGMDWFTDSIGFVCPDTIKTVGIRNEFGCELYDSLQLENPEAYVANFNINPNPTTVKNPIITFQDISRPGPIAKTLFLYGDPPFAEAEERLTQYRFPADTSGEYLITLISESVNGCIDTTSKVLVINDDLLWFIPNSFTPNGDGINDIWRPIGTTVDLKSYSCKVYDRWGRIVFQTADLSKGWNGDVLGSEYYPGTQIFTYVLEITSSTTEDKYELTGHITLIR
jgi:gliding motility-associated-like protein